MKPPIQRGPSFSGCFAELAWRTLPPEHQAELGAAALTDGQLPERPQQQWHTAATITIEDVLRRHSLPVPSTAPQARDAARRERRAGEARQRLPSWTKSQLHQAAWPSAPPG